MDLYGEDTLENVVETLRDLTVNIRAYPALEAPNLGNNSHLLLESIID